MVKLSVYDKMEIKNLDNSRNGYQRNFYRNFHLKDDFWMQFIALMMEE